MLSARSVRGASELSAASDEHVVRSGDGVPAVDDAMETDAHVDRLCSAHSRLLHHLSLRTGHQGSLLRCRLDE